ncbi:MAG: hypothetical protein ABIW84_03540, partial [Ilumatobacteraceae bacterium]
MSLAPSAPVVDIRATLSVYRFGHGDPTTRLTANDFWRATLTPHGPGTIHIWWRSAGLDAEAWGDGATWLLDQVAELTGGGDAGHEFGDESHPAIRRAQRNHRGVRIGASRTLYHELLP